MTTPTPHPHADTQADAQAWADFQPKLVEGGRDE